MLCGIFPLHQASTNISCNITAMKNLEITQNVSLKNYNFEYTPTESTDGRTMLYMANHLACKPRDDLKIYKTNERESTFIELIKFEKTECSDWLLDFLTLDVLIF